MPRPAGMSSESEDEDDFYFSGSNQVVNNKRYDSHALKGQLNANNELNEGNTMNGSSADAIQSNNSVQLISNGTSADSRQRERDLNDNSPTRSENRLTSSGFYSELNCRKSPSPCFSDLSNLSTSFSSCSSANRRRPHKSSLPLDDFRMALVQSNLSVVKSIISQGMSVDQILKSGWTPLMFAASRANCEIVDFLLSKGADPNLHKEMFTALMAACASSRDCEEDILRCVEALLSFGAKPDVAERHRMTPLMFAAKEGRASVVGKLVEAGVDVDKQDNKGWTALSWAATKGHGRVARRLLEASCDPLKTNIHGQTPADVALAAGFSQLADVLERSCFSTEARKELMTSSQLNSHTSSSLNGTKLEKCTEMDMILSGLGLSECIPMFQKHKVTIEMFLRLSEEDLITLGVDTLGYRKVLLNTISQIHKQQWKTSSLPNLSKQSFITLPDSVAMVKNVNKHFRFIQASIGHLRDQIQATPRILELGQEVHNVSTLSNLLGDSLASLSHLENEIKFFKAHLEKICETSAIADKCGADVIVVRKDDGKRWSRHLLTSMIASVSILSLVYIVRPSTLGHLFDKVTPNTISLRIPSVV